MNWTFGANKVPNHIKGFTEFLLYPLALSLSRLDDDINQFYRLLLSTNLQLGLFLQLTYSLCYDICVHTFHRMHVAHLS